MSFSTPILFLVFNRPDTTAIVFEKIKEQRPKYLYVAADGPRINKEGEKEKCEQCKELVLQGVDWDCEVRTLFRSENLGCGIAVSQAITWFFEQVEQGIILEDDCLPNSSFFPFCETLLEHYKHKQEVYSIMGSNPFGIMDSSHKESYFFSKEFTAWGWASWSRAWKNYDYAMAGWDSFLKENRIKEVAAGKPFGKFWIPVLNELKNLTYKYTWDYQWMFAAWYHGAYTIVPVVNMVSNIGHAPDGTHTTDSNSPFANIPAVEIKFPLIHPRAVKANKSLERKYFRKRYFIQTRFEAYSQRFSQFIRHSEKK